MSVDPPAEARSEAVVSAAVSAQYEQAFGVRPSARTLIAGDLVVTMIPSALTQADAAMMQAGRGDVVVTTRALWHHTTRGALIGAVESATGRSVESAIAGTDLASQTSSEVFVLASG